MKNHNNKILILPNIKNTKYWKNNNTDIMKYCIMVYTYKRNKKTMGVMLTLSKGGVVVENLLMM